MRTDQGEDIVITDGSLVLRAPAGTRLRGLTWDAIELTKLTYAVFPVPWERWREDGSSYSTVLPGTSASTNLGLYGGTFGTSQPSIRTYDVKAAGAQSLKARTMIALPERYVAGDTCQIKVYCGMVTTVADTSCTVNIEAYRIGKDNSIGSQICSTGAQSMNSLTASSKTFSITPSTLDPGDVLDVRLTVAVNDAATATAVIAGIFGVDLLCNIQG